MKNQYFKLKLPPLIIFLIISFLSSFILSFDISDYDYPTKENDTKNGIFRIAVFSTNDFHGKIFPNTYDLPNSTNETYKFGGAEYIYAYAKILREEWGEQFIWLDSGNQMTGGIEFTFSNVSEINEENRGEIMNKFFNYAKITATTIGNREFDYGNDFLKTYMNRSKYDYLSSNIYKKNDTTWEWYQFNDNHYKSKIYKIGNISLGIIGVASEETPIICDEFDDENFRIEKHLENIVEEAKRLKNKGANAVILLAHLGLSCPSPFDMELKNRKQGENDTLEERCFVGTLKDLLDDINVGVIDAVIAGHSKQVNHHWINGIPVAQGLGIFYSTVLYLPFNSTTNELIREEISIEGPLPACEKVFDNTSMCENIIDWDTPGKLVEYQFHNKTVRADEKLAEILAPYYIQFLEKKNNIIAHSSLSLSTGIQGDSILYNLITDIGRKVTGADVCIFNTRGVKIRLYPGPISEADIFEVIPYDTIFVTIEMGGNELNRMLYEVQQVDDFNNIRPTSGLMQLFKMEEGLFRLVEVNIFDGDKYTYIDPIKTYVVCIDSFLIKGKDYFADVFKWYTLRNQKNYTEIRDAVTEIFGIIGNITEEVEDDFHYPRVRLLFPFSNDSQKKTEDRRDNKNIIRKKNKKIKEDL